MPALDGAAVKLAEHAAPVPEAHLLLGADLFPAVAKFRENGGERHKLRLVRQVAIEEEVLQREELCRPKEAGQDMVAQRHKAENLTEPPNGGFSGWNRRLQAFLARLRRHRPVGPRFRTREGSARGENRRYRRARRGRAHIPRDPRCVAARARAALATQDRVTLALATLVTLVTLVTHCSVNAFLTIVTGILQTTDDWMLRLALFDLYGKPSIHRSTIYGSSSTNGSGLA